MGRRVKDFIEVSEYTSLDQLINTLSAIRDNLPEAAEPELRMRATTFSAAACRSATSAS